MASREELDASLADSSQGPSSQVRRCAECHREVFDAWLSSQHAWANRGIDPTKDGPPFAKRSELHLGAAKAEMAQTQDTFRISWAEPQEKPQFFSPQAAIGVAPLWQYLVPVPGGRWQVFPLAWDPAAQEWFHVFGEEFRAPQEWGHWLQRGNNWNSQCAACHMTHFEKGYDIAIDSYRSRWAGMGVNCLQCHGSMTGHPEKTPARGSEENFRARAQDSCAACHSRREELTGRFHPGEAFEDHYRLILADQEGVYYPDGQVRQENFEYGSLLMSRMGMKGVSCLNCHDPHSGKLRLPVENNSLCLSCHQSPPKRGALPIDPVAHSHHPAGSKGNLCIECHMPVTKYMQRDPRRDHGFTIPDPLLTRELGIPNACNRCHTDRSPEWAAEWTQKWYGAKMDRHSRRRARLIARAQRREATVVPEILDLIPKEENQAWRASLISLLAPWASEPRVRPLLVNSLKSESPWVRSAAVRALGDLPELPAELESLQGDPSRLVRVDSLWSSVIHGRASGKELKELVQYLENNSDQPPGALKQAQFALAQGQMDKAEAWIRKAADWDRSSAYAQFMKGRVLHLAGKASDALESFQAAQKLEPANAEYAYGLALLLAELQRGPEALAQLRRTVELDPAFGRAWYNLGLAYAQENQWQAALKALEKADHLLPQSPDPAYAQATLFLKRGKIHQAKRALERCLQRDPNFSPARELIQRLNSD